jgi:hypothetical protein
MEAILELTAHRRPLHREERVFNPRSVMPKLTLASTLTDLTLAPSQTMTAMWSRLNATRLWPFETSCHVLAHGMLDFVTDKTDELQGLDVLFSFDEKL